MGEPSKNRGWVVTFAGTGINLALGVLYSWSVISKAIPPEWGWNEADKALPYSIACIVFALMMVPAGQLQDRLGPRIVASAGGVLTGLGCIIASLSSSMAGFVLGFGVLAGAGIGLGYASATPPAVKWFPARKTGLIAGLVVAGFGLASVYIAPLARTLIEAYGVQNSMLIFGVAFLIVVTLLAQLLANPPAGYQPPDSKATGAAAGAAPPVAVNFTWRQMLRTPQFYLAWLMFAFGSGAGLMIIGKLSKIVDLQARIQAGFILVALLAVGNAAGRIVAGMISDKIGRPRTMTIVFVFQAILMFVLNGVESWTPMIAISMLLGFNYGSCLSLFPSVTKDYYGLKSFGLNYGLVFTSWGVGGLILPIISGRIFDATGSFGQAYVIAGVLLLVAAGLSFLLKPPRPLENLPAA